MSNLQWYMYTLNNNNNLINYFFLNYVSSANAQFSPKYFLKTNLYFADTSVACSQTPYFLFKPRGFIDRQRKGVLVGEEENRRSVDIFGSN